jgi:hypothetical protein
MVFANGGLGTQLEVALRREEIIPAPEHLDLQTNSTASPCNAVHINMHTPLAFEQVQAIADREGWMAPVCDRGGAFNVTEFWLKNNVRIKSLLHTSEAEFVDPENFNLGFQCLARQPKFPSGTFRPTDSAG